MRGGRYALARESICCTPFTPIRVHPMAVVYRLTRNNRIVNKRYALKNPEKVTGKEAHPSPSSK